MKKIIFTSVTVFITSSLLFTSCNKKSEGANPSDAKQNEELTTAAEAADEGNLDDYSEYLKKATETLDSFSEGDYSKIMEDAKKISDQYIPEEYKNDYEAAKNELEKIQTLTDSQEYKDALESSSKALESANKALDQLKAMNF